MRVIVTGSRDWTDSQRIIERLRQLPAGSTIVYGANPQGADRIAEFAARGLGLVPEPHPAEWDKYRPKDHKKKNPAGVIRNGEMARLGADLCIAFWDGRSPGTRDMIIQAAQNEIPIEPHIGS